MTRSAKAKQDWDAKTARLIDLHCRYRDTEAALSDMLCDHALVNDGVAICEAEIALVSLKAQIDTLENSLFGLETE